MTSLFCRTVILLGLIYVIEVSLLPVIDIQAYDISSQVTSGSKKRDLSQSIRMQQFLPDDTSFEKTDDNIIERNSEVEKEFQSNINMDENNHIIMKMTKIMENPVTLVFDKEDVTIPLKISNQNEKMKSNSAIDFGIELNKQENWKDRLQKSYEMLENRNEDDQNVKYNGISEDSEREDSNNNKLNFLNKWKNIENVDENINPLNSFKISNKIDDKLLNNFHNDENEIDDTIMLTSQGQNHNDLTRNKIQYSLIHKSKNENEQSINRHFPEEYIGKENSYNIPVNQREQYGSDTDFHKISGQHPNSYRTKIHQFSKTAEIQYPLSLSLIKKEIKQSYHQFSDKMDKKHEKNNRKSQKLKSEKSVDVIKQSIDHSDEEKEDDIKKEVEKIFEISLK